ncbi:MAG: VCBS domain-containing protein, partial [Verrucomicrobiales bacterium]|nr:VCBS domain-containing protein [Verrucomicrobiales bacterium]
MNKTTSSRRKRWFFARSMARAYREWLEMRSKTGNQRGNRSGASAIKANKRPLFAEALEPRVLFSGSPMPVEEPVADDQGAQESVAHTSSALDEGLDAVSQFSFEGLGNEDLNFTESDLERLAAEAIDRWEETGLSADQLEALAQINYVVTDLEGSALAFAEGDSIYIDYNAAGEDWFVDNTEWLDEEFVEIDGILRAVSGEGVDGLARGGVDMLSVLMHEQGHILGLLDEYDFGQSDSSMFGLFEEGERRILDQGQADGSEALSLEGAHYAHLTGTLTQITVTDQASWDSQVGSLTIGHEVVFDGAGGNIAISGDVTVGALHFLSGNFTLTGGELTIDSGSIEADVNATINSVIEGNGDLTKTGVGTLVLGGSNTYTGVTTVSEGILELASDNAVSGTSEIHIDGSSTLQLRNVEVGRPIFANSSGLPGLSSSAIHVVGGGASEISGHVTLERSASIKTRINANTSLVISGGISGNHNLALYDDSSGAAGITVETNPINIGTGTFSGHGLTLNVAGNTAGTFRADWGQAITLNVDNAFTTPPALVVANSSNASGMIDLNGHDLEVSSVTAGQVSSTAIVTDSTGTATLTVTSTSPSTFTGVLSGGLQLTKAGTSDFTLSGNNTYTGVTNVNAGRLIVQSDNALGATSAGTIVSTTGQVLISGDGLTIAEPITVDGNNNTGSGNLGPLRNGGGSNTWTGEITLGGWSRISNAGGTFVVTGGVTSPPGMNYGFVVNNSSGIVRFDTNPIDLDGGSIEFHSGGITELNVTGNDWYETRVRWSGRVQTNVANALPSDTVVVLGVSYNSGMSSSHGQLLLAGNDQTIAGLTDQGAVTRRVSSTSAATLTISNAADHTYAGTITDAISIIKSGAGVQALSGDNTYTGSTAITDGILNLEGAHTGGGAYTLNGSGAILTGSGSTDAAVTVTAGSLSPGVTGVDETGTLNVGSLDLSSATGTFTVDLDGTSNGDLLEVGGSVDLTGSILDVQSVANVATGDTIIILSKVAGGAITGTFVGLAEGATHTQNGHSYTVSYTGGDGNDVTLTALNDAPVANPDTNTVVEAGGSNNADKTAGGDGTTPSGTSGNVLGHTGATAGDAADGDADTDDGTISPDSVIAGEVVVSGIGYTGGGTPVGSEAGGVVTGATPVDGQYGRLIINPDGSYSYELNDAASDTIAAGETGTDEFTYTISDEGSPGLIAGFVNVANNSSLPNPGNLGTSLGPDAYWADNGPRDADRNSTWGDPANKTIIYTGQIFLEAGDTHFLMMSDDTNRLTIDGTLIVNAGGWNTADAGTFTNSTGVAGWFDIEIRTGNGGGGYGFFNQSASGESSWAGIESGFLMKSGGASSTDPNDAGWGHPEDPGDGTLFRSRIGSSSATLTMTVTGTNDVPVITVDTGDSIAETLAESNAGLNTTGTLSVTDFDTSDTVSATVTSVVVTGDDNGLGNAALLAMLTTGTNPVIGNTATTADLNWTFDSGSEAFDYLVASENLVLEYTITVTDSQNTTATQTVTITIRGVNDAPELASVAITSENEGTETALSGTITDADFNGDGYTVTVDWADGNDPDLRVYDLANLAAADGTYNEVTGEFTLLHTYADDDPTGTASDNLTVSVQVWETLGYKLEALYNFDEGDARDGTANGNDGTTSGAGISYSTGDAPAALNGGGVANGEDAGYINVAHSASLGEIDDQLTVSFWIKAELADNDDWFRIMRKGNGSSTSGNPSWIINRTGSTDEVNLRTDTFPNDGINGKHNYNQHSNSGSSVLDGNWHHVTYVLDSGDSREYVDGVLNHTQTYLHGDGLANTDALQLLGRSSTDGIFGSMDDIALYSRALSAAEVAQLASSPVPTNVSSQIVQVVTTVSDAAPTVALTAPAGISENGTATLAGTISDAGTLDTFTINLNWGDAASPGNTQSFTLGTTALTKVADGIDWNPTTRVFSVDHQYLDDNPANTASDSYTISVTVTDDDTLAGMNSTAVTVSNLAPVITVGALDSAAESLTETDAALSVSGTLTVTDVGTLDTTVATVNGTVAISGSSGPLTNADVLPMLTLSNATTGTVGWTFDSSSKPETFDFLAAGETLTLTYTVTVTDDDTGVDTQTVAITITGTNDAPVAVDDRYYFDEDNSSTVIGNGNVTAPGLFGAQLLYETVGFTNFDNADNYTTDNSAGVATGSFDRVAYYLELDGYWVWVSMDAFNPDASLVGVPADNSGIVENGTVVTNLTIESNHPEVVSRTIPRGIIEFWASNYGGGGGGQFNSDNGAFDWKDSGGTTASGHGSFQVADITPGSEEMIFSVTGSGIGIGNQPTGHPDWTFGPNSYSSRNLQVWVGGGQSLLSNDVELDVDGNAPDDAIAVVSAQGSNLVAGTVTVTSDKGASVMVNADGTFSYDPSASDEIQSLSVDEVTTDTFTYTISDGTVTSSASVTISVNGRNDAPVANDDTGYSTTEDGVLTVTAPAALVGNGNVVNAGISGAELLYETVGFTHFDNADNYTTDNSASIAPGSFERVGYYIELDSYFVWVSMDAFNADASLVGVPADYSGIVENGTVVTNLTIESNHPNVASRTIPTGIIEFWASNYNRDGGSQFGSDDAAFDWKDSGGTTNPGHGSFQVADITPGSEEMIFSITGSAMGFGNQPNGGDSPDWTFDRSGTGNSYTVRNLQVWVGGPPNLLANDSEIDVNYTAPDDSITIVEAQGTALTAGTVTVASDKGASVIVNADGTFTYDPNGQFEYLALGESTQDTFEYTISDGNGGSSTATVTVTVNGLNDAPVAVDDGTFESVWQLGQDNGSSGEFEQEGGGSQPAPGSATARDNDYYFAGTYGIGTVAEDEAINDGIPGNSGALIGFERALTGGDPTTRIHFNLAPDELDKELRFVVDNVSNGASGLASGPYEFEVRFNGNLVYTGEITTTGGSVHTTPAFTAASVGAVTGENIITITKTDSNGGWMSFDRLTLESKAVYTTDEDSILTVAAEDGVLINDSDVDIDGNAPDDAITVTSHDAHSAAGALVTVNSDGSFSYDPFGRFDHLAVGESATDTFNYTITDSHGETSSATVTIEITGENDAPVAVDDGALAEIWRIGIDNNGNSEFEQEGGVNAAPGNPNLRDDDYYFAGEYGGTIGTVLEDEGINDGIGGASRVHGFERAFVNGDADSRIHFNLDPGQLNDDFVFNVDFYYLGGANVGGHDIRILFNGVEIHEETITAATTITTAAVSGASVNAVTGENVLTIQRLDNRGGWIVMDYLSLSAVQVHATTENAILTVDGTEGVLSNDSDVDTTNGFTVTAFDSTSAGGAAVTVNADGSFTYDPNGQFDYLAEGVTATDTFGYTITDSDGGTDTATVTIVITGTNDAPVANPDTNTAVEAGGVNNGTVAVGGDGTTVSGTSGNVMGGTGVSAGDAADTDADSDDIPTAGDGSVVVTHVEYTGGGTAFGSNAGGNVDGATQVDGQYGTLTLNADGSYDYILNTAASGALAAGEFGTEEFTYTISDGVIYADDFSGSGALSGATPDTAPGADAWTSSGLWNADGTKTGNGTGSAWLPFSPDSGKVYTLSADVNPDLSASGDWMAIGFGGLVPASMDTTQFQAGGNNGAAWMLFRENDESGSVIQTFGGPATAAGQSHDLTPEVVGSAKLEVILDTTGANWKVEWKINGTTLRSYTYGSNPTIASVGLGGFNSATGSIDNFSLVEGEVSSTTLTITVEGTNDTPVITSPAQTGSVTETVDNAGGTDLDPAAATGTITFDDSDLTDTHTATILPGSSVTGGTATLTAAQEAALLDNLSLGAVQNDTPGDGSGAVDWTYTVPNSEIDFLAAGETVEVTHMVAVSDAGVIFNGDFSANAADFTSYPGYLGGANPGSIEGWTHTGRVGVNPVVAPGSGSPFANNGANSTPVAFIQRTGSISQTISGLVVGQTYAVSFDYNERATGGSTTVSATIAGETFTDPNNSPVGGSNPYRQATLLFTATATSETLTISAFENGGTDQTTLIDNVRIDVTQKVVVTLTGANDSPVITSPAQTGTVTETVDNVGGVDPDPAPATGTIAFDDTDLSDTHTVEILPGASVTGGTATLTAAQEAALLDNLSLGAVQNDTPADGSGKVDWSYTVPNSEIDFLSAGETVEVTHTVVVSDSEMVFNGGFEANAADFDTYPGYISNPNNPAGIEGWTHVGSAGLNHSGAGGPGTPFANNGDNSSTVAFIQRDGSISQTVSGLVVGQQYALLFDYNERAGGGAPDSTTVSATIAGATFTDSNNSPVGGSNSYRQATLFFTATATSETLTISSISNGGDQTTLIDNVRIGVTQDVVVTLTGANDEPVVNIAATDINESESTVLTGDFIDPDLNDTHTITVAWGDPNSLPDSVFTLPKTGEIDLAVEDTFTSAGADSTTVLTITSLDKNTGEVTFTVEHQYIDDDVAGTPSDDYTVTVTIADDDTGVGSDSDVITVSNVAPEPEPDFYKTTEAAVLTISTPAAGVLGNDNDAANPNGPLTAPLHDPLTVAGIDTSATKGIVTMNADGTFSYDPNGQFEYLGVGQSENDTFTYTVADNDGGTTTETVTITVTGVNDAPVAVEDVVTVFEGGQGGSETVSGNALGNDSDVDQSGTPDDDVIRVVNIKFEGTPFGGATQAGGAVSSSGTLVNGLYGTLSINAKGEFVYTVDGNLPTTRALDTGDVGVETFTYLISDGNGGFDEAQIVVR